MHKLQGLLILILVLVSLAGFYTLYRFLYKRTVARHSFSALLLFVLLVVLAVFCYTFLVVFIIRLLFPPA